MISINKLRKRNMNTNNSDDIHSQYIEDYQFYFDNALNKIKYKDKYNNEINGEGILLDVSEYNQKNGDEKWMTTLPNSNIELLSVIALEFAKDITEYWIVEDKENLVIPSHEKFKISPLCFLGILKRYGTQDKEVDTKVVDSQTDTKNKTIYFSPKVEQIKVGDYIYYDNVGLTYLVNEVQNFTKLPYAVSKECNYTLKWMNGKLYQTPVIITNQTKYTLGVTSPNNATITEGDSRFEITMPYNSDTKKITIGQRLIANGEAWKVTQVDFVSNVGIQSILLGQSAINYEIDDIENEIAGAFQPKHTYTWNLPTSFEVTKDSEYILPYNIVDETGKEIDYSLVTVNINDNTLINIIKTDKKITIKGLNIGTGTIKLDIPIGETVEEKVINFEVKSVPVNQIDYETNWSQTTNIKQYVTSVFTCKKTNNGIQDNSLKIDFSFDSNGQNLINSKKIIVTKLSDSSFSIKNALITTKTDIYVTVIDTNNSNYKILDNQLISLVKGV